MSSAHPGALVNVPGFFIDENGALRQLSAMAPRIPTPQDDNISPTAGDDTSSPNAVTAGRLNRVLCVGSATVGYSKAAKDKDVLPSAIEYDASVEEGDGLSEFALTLRITLEYESSFPMEGMVVWLKKYQQIICDETDAELVLVETTFQDFVRGQWETITTDVRYAEEAEAVVQAVVTSASGQTAGRVKTEGSLEDAKMGPVGERGRIVLTYRCGCLYSYTEMSMGTASHRSLVPLALQLPWGALDNPGNRCMVKAAVRAPPGTSLLNPEANVLAYRDLQQSLSSQLPNDKHQVVIMPSATANSTVDTPTWSFQRSTLPPRPTMVFTWLSIPDTDDGWEQVPDAIPKNTRATLLKPTLEDMKLLSIFAPGRLEAHLVRCVVETEAPPRSPNSVRVHTDITISDASGSTGMTHAHMGQPRQTTRSMFNKLEETRLLKRLEAIPILRDAGVLLQNDIWIQILVVFDDGVRQEFGIETSIGDLDNFTVTRLLKLSNAPDASAENELRQAGRGTVLDQWRQLLENLRGTAPGGLTSFASGATQARKTYLQLASKHCGKACTTYVNFDTDGGNNCGSCYDAVKALVSAASVVQGHVTGVGAWVDQDCASRVAKILKGSATLSLGFPQNADADCFFRQDLSRWIKVIRTVPVTVKVSAGSLTWQARHGFRHENGVDVLFAEGSGLKFDQPDVSDINFTKAVLCGLQAGESTTMYLLSRRPWEHLIASLHVEVDGIRARVVVGADPMKSVILGHHWLSLLSGQPSGNREIVTNRSALCARLAQRLEDDMSFAWNLPTRTGSTAAVGRATTEKRLPVPKEHQPDEPSIPSITSDPPPDTRPMFRGPPARGCPAVGAPPPAAFLQPQSAPVQVPSGSRLNHFFGGGGAPFASAGSVHSYGGGFGSCVRATAPPSKPISLSGRFGDGGDSPDMQRSKPLAPSMLLRHSFFMRVGTAETSREALVRAVQALRYVAANALAPGQTGNTVQASAEDPLVVTLLGPRSEMAAATGGATHWGFICDSSGENPIVGTRYKATSAKDMDITETCRRQGRYPTGGSGWRPIPDPALALRISLMAVLEWWQVLWSSRSDLFGGHSPQLETLSVAELANAVGQLPVDW